MNEQQCRQNTALHSLPKIEQRVQAHLTRIGVRAEPSRSSRPLVKAAALVCTRPSSGKVGQTCTQRQRQVQYAYKILVNKGNPLLAFIITCA